MYKYHLEWANKCIAAASAKVLIIFGQENREYFHNEWGNRLREMKLWGDYEGISLWLLYAEGDDFARVERLVLFVWHPEYVEKRK